MNFRKFTPQGELHCAAANTKTSSSPTTTASLLSAHNASRQSCAFKEYYLFPSSNNNSYDDSSSSSSFDQEIYISPKSTVYWSQGEVLFKSFDFSKRPGQRVLAALFAYFVCDEVQDRQRGYLTPPSTPSVPGSPSANGTSDFFLSAHRFSPNNLLSSLSSRLVDDDEEEDEEEGGDDNDKSPRLPWSSPPVRALCIILNDSAKFYFDNGKAYTTSFPFSVKNAWPLRVGLMIQADDGSNGSNNTTNKESLPTIFSLLHPLEELRIVSARQCDDNDMDNNNSCNSTTTIYAQGVEVDEGGGDGELCNDDSDKRTNATYATTTATKTSERRGEFGLLQDESILHVSDSHVISYSPRLKKHSIWTYIIRPVVDSTSDKLSAGTHRSSATNAAGRTRRSSRRTSLAEYTSSFETDQAVLTSTAVRQMKSIVHLERRDLLNIGCKGAADSIAIGNTSNGSSIVWLLFKDVKKAFAVEIGSVYNDDIINRTPRPSPVVHQVNAISMASVKATRNGLIDVLFLQPDHSLVVWTGGNTFFPLTMPINHQTLLDSDATTSKRRRSSLDSSEDVLFPNYRSAAMDGVAVDAAATSSSISSRKIFRSPSKSSRIVSIKDTVDNRVNLVLSNGVVLRATLDFCPRSHLVRTCFQALSYVLPDSTFELLRLRYLVQQFGSSGKQPQSRLQPVLQNGEWCNFLVAFFSFCHSKPSIMKTTRGGVSAMDSLTGNGGGYSSFAALLNSNYHHAFLSDPTLARLDNIFKFNSSESSSASSSRSTLEKYHDLSKELYLQHHTQPNFQFFLPLALLSLHLVYEDFKLNLVTQKYIQPLSHLLSCLAKALKWDAYLKHYHQDGTDMVLQSLLEVPASVCEVPESLVASPPSIYSWFESIISNTTKPEPFPQISSLSGLAVNEKVTPLPPLGSLCSQTSLVVSFYNCLFHSSSVRVGLNNKNQRQILNEKLVEIMVKSNFKLKDVDRLPFGVALPLRQAIRSCRTTPPSSWGADAYALIGREDLAQQFTGRKISSPYSPIMNFAKTDLESVDANELMESAIDNPHSKQKLGDDTTVATLNDEIMRLRFSGDSRIKDLKMMFDNTKSFRLHLEIAPHSSEQDVSNEQQSLLQCLANRTFSLALGRAMFTLSCAPPIPTEAIPIPDVNISARLPPLNAVINLDITSLSSDLKDWPEFHEGVAAGLCIPSSESGMEIDGSWIYYNQDAPDSCKHAGFLMALGVSGHLKKMVSWHSYVYLVPKHDLTTIGLMLGLGAAYVGTMDHLVTKLLCVHIPALLPPSSSELNTSKLIQAASLFGIGLAYMGTAHRGMMEACLAEIGGKRRLTSSVNDGGASGIGGNGSACAATESAHIECYSLAAGFALGFIVLGKGERAGTLAERNIVDELHSFIVGVNQSEQKNGARHLSNKSSSSTTASTTFPAESIYTDVTSPGATVALTLMFLKTNSLRIAEKLILPSTRFMLDYFRPDFLLLRVTCRNLIMWDHIQPTKEWVLSQVPSFIRELLDDLGHEKHNWRQSSPPRTTTTWTNATADADIEGFQHAFFNMVAGACFAVGLKFAGSAHSAAFQTLSHWVDFFIKSTSLPAHGHSLKLKRFMLRSCLDVVLTSLSLVMAGTGNLQVFKRLRQLHLTRLTTDYTYGNHMATHMAMGLLFLGGGRFTVSTSLKSIACLLCSLYPKYPLSTSDNRSHLQAVRHLWVLAVTDRCLVTMDVESQKLCSVPIIIKLKRIISSTDNDVRNNSSNNKINDFLEVSMTTPCILPDFSNLVAIRINSTRYWSLSIDSVRNRDHWRNALESRIIYVKRKIGSLDYMQDPKGQRSIFATSFPKNFGIETTRNRRSLENFIKSFSADPLILAFANHLCRPPSFSYSPSSNNNKERGTDETSDAASLATFCTSVLYECLTQDKPEILQTYLSIYQTFQHQSRQVQQGLQKRSSTAIAALSLYKDASLESSLRNVHIVKMFYEHHDEAERLITPSFLFSK